MKLRGRFTLTLALAALVPITVAAVTTRHMIASKATDTYLKKRENAKAAVEGALGRLSNQVSGVVRSLASPKHPYVDGMVVDSLKDSLERVDFARWREQSQPWMQGLSLDVLAIGIAERDDAPPRVIVAPHYKALEREDLPELRGKVLASQGRAFFHLEEVGGTEGSGTGQPATKRILVAEAGMRFEEHSGLVFRYGYVLAGRQVTAELLKPIHEGGQDTDARIVAPGGGVLVPPGPYWSALAGDDLIRVPLDGIDGKPVAFVEIAVSNKDLAVLRTLTYLSAGLALAALGAVVLIGLLVARRTARDLDALVEGSLAASRGDLDHRVPVRSKDEIGAVASAFNFMMEDLRTSKERLVIAERIAAWQEIARRLAHEIKNPLTPIQMAMDTLRKTWKKQHPSFDEILEESTTTVLQEADRLKHIVAEFSDFARMPKPDFQRVDLNEVVRSALTLYQGALALDVKLGELPQLDADKNQLNQVVLNLVENARDAIGKRPNGKITVATRLGEAGDRAVLVVEDNGPGVPGDLKDKVFAPYFTTKHAKGGTGLGLAIVHRIVSDHGGRIAVSDAPGGGARFSIELPLRNGTALLASRI
ncbi:MAG TPA: ATP-binding protein [Kofleriaceae bacterium]|nr:ATP-binding protein [Kofleriaceae bacterium]